VLWGLAFLMSVVTIARPSYLKLFLTFCLGIVTSTYVTSVYGPFLLVSSLITAHTILFSFVRDWLPRIAIITIGTVAWTLAVFGASLGVFPETVRFVDGDMLIHSSVIGFPATTTTIYLYASVLATILFPALVVGFLRTAYDRSELAMRLQSWQLRRLVSDASTPIWEPRSSIFARRRRS
jgi:cell shape-determining protein MreD